MRGAFLANAPDVGVLPSVGRFIKIRRDPRLVITVSLSEPQGQVTAVSWAASDESL